MNRKRLALFAMLDGLVILFMVIGAIAVIVYDQLPPEWSFVLGIAVAVTHRQISGALKVVRDLKC